MTAIRDLTNQVLGRLTALRINGEVPLGSAAVRVMEKKLKSRAAALYKGSREAAAAGSGEKIMRLSSMGFTHSLDAVQRISLGAQWWLDA